MELCIANNYISCGCNKIPHCADWGDNGLTIFGSGNTVAIVSLTDNGTSKISTHAFHHKSRVNSIRWIKVKSRTGSSYSNTFVTCSSDSTAAVWTETKTGYSVVGILKEHKAAVTVADGFLYDGDTYGDELTSLLLATASNDSTVKIWEKSAGSTDIHCIDTIDLKNGIALDLRMTNIADSAVVACSLDDNKVHIYGLGKNEHFQKLHVVSGHDDWIRAMDFCSISENVSFFATASQDAFIRVYKIYVKDVSPENENSDYLDTEESIFYVGDKVVGLKLETVLAGHENWIYGLSWHYDSSLADLRGLKLLSSSMDKSLVVWSPQDGLWLETARVGEVGGNNLGFYGGKFGPDGKSILAHGYQGSFHHWKHRKDESWEPEVVVGGHVGDVVDMSWAPNGRFLLSCSTDQTTRLHAPWVQNKKVEWREIARPQVHGHDMSCLTLVTNTTFVSGAEEKVLRSFSAPRNFLDNFERICGVRADDNIKIEDAPEGAAVPALGLSNKPVFVDGLIDTADPEAYFSPLTLDRPPTEENLLQNTLWPEIQKIYGHGYELHCVAARPDGAVVASACRASQSEHAAVILWDARTWMQKQKLPFHQLTVTQMSFSPDGNYFLTVSRDRKWCLYQLNETTNSYEVAATGVKTLHTRVIWCCAWTTDGLLFATGSREGQICVWSRKDGSLVASTKDPNGSSITSLAFTTTEHGKQLLFVGTDSGLLLVYLFEENSLRLSHTKQIHASTVRRILFRPGYPNQFATCSEDFSVKIHQIT